MSFKNGLRVYTTSNAINDALMTDFRSQNGSKIGPKSVPKCFQRALEGALDEDSDSKLKKERSRSIGGAADGIKLDGFWVTATGEQGGSNKCPHTPDNLVTRTRGRRIWL